MGSGCSEYHWFGFDLRTTWARKDEASYRWQCLRRTGGSAGGVGGACPKKKRSERVDDDETALSASLKLQSARDSTLLGRNGVLASRMARCDLLLGACRFLVPVWVRRRDTTVIEQSFARKIQPRYPYPPPEFHPSGQRLASTLGRRQP